MGCDIHLFTERKRSINSEDIWINIDNWKLNPYYPSDNESQYHLKEVYNGRDYQLFAMLANVRNRSDNEYISKPKGIPDDASLAIKDIVNRWDSDGHSHSYLTMKELYDFYETHNTVKYSGLVDPDGAKAIDRGEMPEMWCQASNVPNHVWREWTHENEILKSFISDLEKHFKSEYYNKEEDSEKFRIVFFFDN